MSQLDMISDTRVELSNTLQFINPVEKFCCGGPLRVVSDNISLDLSPGEPFAQDNNNSNNSITALPQSKSLILKTPISNSDIEELHLWGCLANGRIQRENIGGSGCSGVEMSMDGVYIDNVYYSTEVSSLQSNFTVALNAAASIALRILGIRDDFLKGLRGDSSETDGTTCFIALDRMLIQSASGELNSDPSGSDAGSEFSTDVAEIGVAIRKRLERLCDIACDSDAHCNSCKRHCKMATLLIQLPTEGGHSTFPIDGGSHLPGDVMVFPPVSTDPDADPVPVYYDHSARQDGSFNYVCCCTDSKLEFVPLTSGNRVYLQYNVICCCGSYCNCANACGEKLSHKRLKMVQAIPSPISRLYRSFMSPRGKITEAIAVQWTIPENLGEVREVCQTVEHVDNLVHSLLNQSTILPSVSTASGALTPNGSVNSTPTKPLATPKSISLATPAAEYNPPAIGNKLIFPLQHMFPPHKLEFENLMGVDRMTAASLLLSGSTGCKNRGLEVYMAVLTKTVIGYVAGRAPMHHNRHDNHVRNIVIANGDRYGRRHGRRGEAGYDRNEYDSYSNSDSDSDSYASNDEDDVQILPMGNATPVIANEASMETVDSIRYMMHHFTNVNNQHLPELGPWMTYRINESHRKNKLLSLVDYLVPNSMDPFTELDLVEWTDGKLEPPLETPDEVGQGAAGILTYMFHKVVLVAWPSKSAVLKDILKPMPLIDKLSTNAALALIRNHVIHFPNVLSELTGETLLGQHSDTNSMPSSTSTIGIDACGLAYIRIFLNNLDEYFDQAVFEEHLTDAFGVVLNWLTGAAGNANGGANASSSSSSSSGAVHRRGVTNCATDLTMLLATALQILGKPRGGSWCIGIRGAKLKEAFCHLTSVVCSKIMDDSLSNASWTALLAKGLVPLVRCDIARIAGTNTTIVRGAVGSYMFKLGDFVHVLQCIHLLCNTGCSSIRRSSSATSSSTATEHIGGGCGAVGQSLIPIAGEVMKELHRLVWERPMEESLVVHMLCISFFISSMYIPPGGCISDKMIKSIWVGNYSGTYSCRWSSAVVLNCILQLVACSGLRLNNESLKLSVLATSNANGQPCSNFTSVKLHLKYASDALLLFDNSSRNHRYFKTLLRSFVSWESLVGLNSLLVHDLFQLLWVVPDEADSAYDKALVSPPHNSCDTQLLEMSATNSMNNSRYNSKMCDTMAANGNPTPVVANLNSNSCTNSILQSSAARKYPLIALAMCEDESEDDENPPCEKASVPKEDFPAIKPAQPVRKSVTSPRLIDVFLGKLFGNETVSRMVLSNPNVDWLPMLRVLLISPRLIHNTIVLDNKNSLKETSDADTQSKMNLFHFLLKLGIAILKRAICRYELILRDECRGNKQMLAEFPINSAIENFLRGPESQIVLPQSNRKKKGGGLDVESELEFNNLQQAKAYADKYFKGLYIKPVESDWTNVRKTDLVALHCAENERIEFNEIGIGLHSLRVRDGCFNYSATATALGRGKSSKLRIEKSNSIQEYFAALYQDDKKQCRAWEGILKNSISVGCFDLLTSENASAAAAVGSTPLSSGAKEDDATSSNHKRTYVEIS